MFDYIPMKGKDVHIFTGLSAEQANKWLDDRNIALYRKTNDGYECKRCGATIMQTTLYISEHIKFMSGCAGSGEVQCVNLAYCPNCEGEPKIARACIHD